LLPCYTVT